MQRGQRPDIAHLSIDRPSAIMGHGSEHSNSMLMPSGKVTPIGLRTKAFTWYTSCRNIYNKDFVAGGPPIVILSWPNTAIKPPRAIDWVRAKRSNFFEVIPAGTLPQLQKWPVRNNAKPVKLNLNLPLNKTDVNHDSCIQQEIAIIGRTVCDEGWSSIAWLWVEDIKWPLRLDACAHEDSNAIHAFSLGVHTLCFSCTHYVF